MQEVRFREEDLAYMRGMTSSSGAQVFDDDFLKWLKADGNFGGINLYAIPEGRVVHPNIPLTMVVGPLGQAQLLETRLLNELNYQTLIATKAARIHQAGRGGLMMEFGARRAHGTAAIAGARARHTA
jgi:nicotinate phosphoribosyltransferase